MMTVRNDDDLSLINRFKEGDPSAFEEVVLKYQDKIYSLCRHMLGNAHDAEDAAQEAFVAAYRSLPAWRGEGPFAAWLSRIALHIALRRARQTRPLAWIDPAGLDGGDDLPGSGPDTGSQRRVARHFRDASLGAASITDPAGIAIAVEQATDVREALAGLEEPYREVVALRYFAELTVPEIAAACDRPQGTVKTHLHRGLLRLRDRLDAQGAER